MNQDNTVKMLHEFLQRADNNSPQIFLAHIAMLAAQDARRQIQPIHLQKLNLAQFNLNKVLQQHQQLEVDYQLLQQDYKLLKQHVLPQSFSEDHPEKDAVWIDPKTGLMWSRISIGQQWQDGHAKGEAKKMDWDEANQACEQLHLAGFSDWRLPSKAELESLMKPNSSNYNAPDGVFTQPILQRVYEFGIYWSSSLLLSNKKYAWLVYFNYGYSHYSNRSDLNYVRAVRKDKI